MDSQIRISDLENVISEKVFIKIEKWNLYLGDAGLARNLAIECISNKDQGPTDAAKIACQGQCHGLALVTIDRGRAYPAPIGKLSQMAN